MNEKRNPLRIVKLEVENIKRLKAVSVTPTTNVVTISGRNDQGKSSLLDSIEMVICGKDSIPERPIRDGQSHAEIVCDFDELIVTRTFSANGGSKLSVETKDGVALKTPQAILDQLTAHISFDPEEFISLCGTPDGRRKQAETLRKLVGLDFTALDAERQQNYDKRTLVNRDLAQAEAKVASLTFDESAPVNEQSASELMQELNRANAFNHTLEAKHQEVRQFKEDIAAADDAIFDYSNKREEALKLIAHYEKEITSWQARKDELHAKHKAGEQELSKVEPVDIAPIESKIASVDTVNATVRANAAFRACKAKINVLREESNVCSRRIDAIDADKKKQLAEAEFPMQGVTFNDSGVLLNNVPFEQGSTARKLQAAVAIGLAMNPRIRVVLIRRGNDLDDDSLAMLEKMAGDQGFQVWLEVVKSSDPSAVVIEDGEVKPSTQKESK